MCPPSWFTHLRAILELLYFFSGVVLTIGVVVAIRQLSLTRTEMALRYKREAIVASLKQCESFSSFLANFGPRFQDIFNRQPAVLRTRWSPRNLVFDESTFDFKTDAGRWLQGVSSTPDRLIKAIGVCNDLETFSLPFMKGAADEATAFVPVAAVFCELVEKFLPLIVALRNGILLDSSTQQRIASGPWENVLGLYAIWSTRVKKDALVSRASSLLAEADKIEVKGIEPLGMGDRGRGKH
jgi:hypothetical protein